MIFVQRSAKPATLAKNEFKWLKKLRKARVEKDQHKFDLAQSKYKHQKVKDALKAMFSGKCAFCENLIEAVAYAHIEHFRPKSRYLSLTFDWKNLYLSCPMCNGTEFKGEKFPKATEGGPLIDPCVDDPKMHFTFEYDRRADLAFLKPTSSRGSITVTTLGLNSRKELIRARTSYLKKLLVLKSYEKTDPRAAQILSQARTAGEPFKAWIDSLL